MSGESCFNCAFCVRETEAGEMPHIYWYECEARPANAMLKQFPFKRTTCKRWKLTRRTPPIRWELLDTAGTDGR